MNNSIAVPNERPWPLQPYDPHAAQPLPGQRTYSAAHILDFPTLVRILYHWRWLILGAVALGLAAGMLVTLLTTPLYRAWVTSKRTRRWSRSLQRGSERAADEHGQFL